MVLHVRKALKVRVHRVSGYVKDRIAIARVKLCRNQHHAALQVSLICATSHKETIPGKELVSLVLQADTGSRMVVSQCIHLLMERLNKTRSWIVALKCLTLIHKALHHGGFIFQDQLSFHPRNGGKNYLNLSRFRDNSSPFAWDASSWIRWYANFLEALVEASKCTGRFLDSTLELSSAEKVLGLQNNELMVVILSLSTLLREICNHPLKSNVATSHSLIRDSLELVVMDCIKAQNELHIHMKEICQRLNDLSVSQISQLLHVCETLTSESGSLMQLTNLAFAMKILEPQQCLDGIVFADYELMHIKAALTTLQRVQDKALVSRQPVRKDLSNNTRFPFKLSPPSKWTSPKVSQKQLQSSALPSL